MRDPKEHNGEQEEERDLERDRTPEEQERGHEEEEEDASLPGDPLSGDPDVEWEG